MKDIFIDTISLEFQRTNSENAFIRINLQMWNFEVINYFLGDDEYVTLYGDWV